MKKRRPEIDFDNEENVKILMKEEGQRHFTNMVNAILRRFFEKK